MIWKSILEEYPYTNDEIWIRWTTDGVNYHEEILHEKSLDKLECMGVPEWREMEAPEWMTTEQKEKFDRSKGTWNKRLSEAAKKDANDA